MATGLVYSMNGVGASIGLVGGAWITQTLSWQTNYTLLAPVAVVVTILMVIKVRESSVRAKEKLDFVGTTLFGFALVGLLVGLSAGGEFGWTSTLVLGLFIMAVISAVLLVAAERRIKDPLINLTIPNIRSILKVNFLMFVTGLCMFIAYETIIYFTQEPGVGFGFSVTQAALILLPAALMMLWIFMERDLATKVALGPSSITYKTRNGKIIDVPFALIKMHGMMNNDFAGYHYNYIFWEKDWRNAGSLRINIENYDRFLSLYTKWKN